ncbi:hypothetical protein Hlac_2859 [Halorubrum lacusprofundi ATCC 49239]|uniref:Uncharacterized protein n=1 Tax=Halorubrum lacusprofundi (strain ATCC 49239 / DSM 5036 / JCM 8891 / ACAM 34) TaxID=416348 RepID=B9LW29_HALLT|nr:hypothetical protein Hlac_2859 [Halorubrum lacusprofundi ATCC 49239]
MDIRRRTLFRFQRLCYRWKLLKHPYGYDYVRQQYSLTGKRTSPDGD